MSPRTSPPHHSEAGPRSGLPETAHEHRSEGLGTSPASGRRRRLRTGLAGAAVAGACLSSLLVGPSAGAVTTTPASTQATTRTPLASAPYRFSAADLRMRSRLTARASTTVFGRGFSGSVRDAETGQLIWRSRSETGRMPASTTKLVTAVDALSVYGPDHRFTTTVRQGSTPDSVVLVGSGDPSLSSRNLATLALDTAASLSASGVTSVTLWADDYRFARATRAYGWKASNVPGDVRLVRALVVDGRNVNDTTMDAAKIFAKKLEAAGLTVRSVGRARVPRGTAVLASTQGLRMDQIVHHMLLVSDNDYAEALHRLVGIATGYGSTWTGARKAQVAALADQGFALPYGRLFDGSGISRKDRLTANQLSDLVRMVLDPQRTDLAVMTTGGALPVSGRSGTLAARYKRFTTSPSTCARGEVTAKTGTLNDAVALAGWTTGTDGRTKTFAFLVNGKRATKSLMQRVDALAATVNGCY
jgi:D-alanyl-D-alanine carboxypeptidase/D-alanyl-D-alanine-endopeptidase (penicillin-binding protein 4)